jgi:SAM-dependent methyltransferase
MLLPAKQRIAARRSDGRSRQELSLSFNANYFTTGNYGDYLSRAGRYQKMAKEIDGLFRSMGVGKQILDFGCAVGFLVKGMTKRGYDVTGYDQSAWAIEYGTKVVKAPNLTQDYAQVTSRQYDAAFLLDVLEHNYMPDIEQILSDIKAKYLVVRIPVCEAPFLDFVLPESRSDPTHVTCMPKRDWTDLLASKKYLFHTRLSLKTIWDSPGVLSAIYKAAE